MALTTATRLDPTRPWPRVRVTENRTLVSDPASGIGLSFENQPRLAWLTILMLQLPPAGKRFPEPRDPIILGEPIAFEYSLN